MTSLRKTVTCWTKSGFGFRFSGPIYVRDTWFSQCYRNFCQICGCVLLVPIELRLVDVVEQRCLEQQLTARRFRRSSLCQSSGRCGEDAAQRSPTTAWAFWEASAIDCRSDSDESDSTSSPGSAWRYRLRCHSHLQSIRQWSVTDRVWITTLTYQLQQQYNLTNIDQLDAILFHGLKCQRQVAAALDLTHTLLYAHASYVSVA